LANFPSSNPLPVVVFPAAKTVPGLNPVPLPPLNDPMLNVWSVHGLKLLLASTTHFSPLFTQNPSPGAPPEVELSLFTTA
jgi:hypothetical protein